MSPRLLGSSLTAVDAGVKAHALDREMRRTIADLSAGALAVIVLVFAGLVVVKPALDRWDDLYRGNPFRVKTTIQKTAFNEKDGRLTEKRIVTKQTPASFFERVLGKGGLLFLRLGLVALAALLAAAVLHRAILGEYGLRAGLVRRPRAAPPEGALDGAFRAPDDSDGATASMRDGPTKAQEAGGENLAPAIAKLVASRREELGLSQRELAKRAGISHTVVSRIEGGEHSPSARTLDRLADALHVPGGAISRYRPLL
jgi:DNA-binding XRE family transcriptional regulator